MRSAARFLVVLSLLGALLALPIAAFAGDGLVLATEEPTEEEMVDEPMFEEGQEPAEIAPPESEPDEEQPWTSRYIAPTILLLGVLTTLGFVAYYGVRVRSQYEVVD